MTTELDKPQFAVDTAMDDLEVLLAGANLAERRSESNDPMAWLPEWFLQQSADLDAASAIVKAQAATMQKQIESRRKALWWKWGLDFQAQVSRDLAAQGGKKKSVDYLTGRAGNRTSSARTSVVVMDAASASLELDKVCPDAVRYTINKSEVLKYHEETGADVPGIEFVQIPASESFYPQPPDREQLEAEIAAMLPQEGNTDDK